MVGNFREGFIFAYFASQEPFVKIKTANFFFGRWQSERTTFQSGYFKLSFPAKITNYTVFKGEFTANERACV